MSNVQLARNLRKRATDTEKKLWFYLGGKRLKGCKFRRQALIGNYIVDFVCYEKRLIIELDGGQHANQEESDKRRTRFLEGEGFRVLRFWNNEVSENISVVVGIILEELTFHKVGVE